MQILIKNGWVITCDHNKNQFKKGNLIIKDGTISDINEQEFINTEAFDKVINAQGKIIIPGLINAHIHSYANLVKATTENIPLEMWMLYIMAEGKCMDPEDVYYNTLLGCIEMIKTGTTSCVDHLAQGIEGLDGAMQAYYEMGMRAAIAPMISDKGYYETLPIASCQIPDELKQTVVSSPQTLIDTTLSLLKKWMSKEDRLAVMVGPSGPQRCSDELLKQCMRIAIEYDTGFHTHVLETKYQAQTAHFLYDQPMLMNMDKLGCLNARTSLVHGVWLTEEEAKLAADKRVIIVHNPASNLILGSGVAPVNLYRKLGIKVALGTDGANCGGNLNMFESLKLAAMLHKHSEPNPEEWITAQEVLEMATINSAKVSLQDKKIGSLEIGKKADVVILDPEKSPAMLPLQNPLWQIVYSESGSSVDTVLVEGKVLLEEGKLCGIDEKAIYKEVNRRAEKVVERSLLSYDSVKKQAELIKNILFR